MFPAAKKTATPSEALAARFWIVSLTVTRIPFHWLVPLTMSSPTWHTSACICQGAQNIQWRAAPSWATFRAGQPSEPAQSSGPAHRHTWATPIHFEIMGLVDQEVSKLRATFRERTCGCGAGGGTPPSQDCTGAGTGQTWHA